MGIQSPRKDMSGFWHRDEWSNRQKSRTDSERVYFLGREKGTILNAEINTTDD